MKKKLIILSVFLALSVFAVFYYGSLIDFQVAQAGDNPPPVDNSDHEFEMFGWAWSSTIGLISFNCQDTNTCATSDYKVTVAHDTYLRGYAWSENIGWIKFDNLGNNFPNSPNYSARLDIDGYVKDCQEGRICGWARACAGTVPGDCSTNMSRDDGWDGWIRFENSQVVPFNSDKSKLEGWAWGSNVVGWINLDGVEIEIEIKRPEIPEIDGKPFKVIQGDYCNKSHPQIYLEWDFECPHIDPHKTSYQNTEIQIIKSTNNFPNNNDCGSNCVYEDDNIIASPGNPFLIPEGHLEFNAEYKARIRVFNQYGTASEWSEKTFKTRIRYPYVEIELDRPATPTAFEASYFVDKTNYHDWQFQFNRSGQICLEWDFENGNPDKIEQCIYNINEIDEAVTEFTEKGIFDVDLTISANIRDENNSWLFQSCSLSFDEDIKVNIHEELPEWREISPYD